MGGRRHLTLYLAPGNTASLSTLLPTSLSWPGRHIHAFAVRTALGEHALADAVLCPQPQRPTFAPCLTCQPEAVAKNATCWATRTKRTEEWDREGAPIS